MKYLREITDLSHMENHYSNYTLKDKFTLSKYGFHSYNLNSALWSAHKKNHSAISDDMKEPHNAMIDAVNRHETPSDMTVYSGLRYNNYKGKPGDIFHHPAYLSTSLDPAIANRFAVSHSVAGSHMTERHILKIHVPKGTKGAYMGHFDNPLARKEKELVLPAGTNLKHEKTLSVNDADNSEVTHYHHMSVVP